IIDFVRGDRPNTTRQGISPEILACAEARSGATSGLQHLETAKASTRRWREENKEAQHRLMNNTNSGSEGFFGNLNLSGGGFPRGFVTCTSHCPKQQSLDIEIIRRDLEANPGLKKALQGKEGVTEERVQVYRGGKRMSLFRSRVRAEDFLVPLPTA
ncbi:unnamed protein product, partial [Amoebophrya sp. A25]